MRVKYWRIAGHGDVGKIRPVCICKGDLLSTQKRNIYCLFPSTFVSRSGQLELLTLPGSHGSVCVRPDRNNFPCGLLLEDLANLLMTNGYSTLIKC